MGLLSLFENNETIGPFAHDDVELTIDVQRHLLKAAVNGESKWRYRSDGRIHTAPNVANGIAYVASTAGTITALNIADGSIRWRFLGATNEEVVVVNGQLSRWPIYNTVLKDDVLYFCAGRQVELDGGIQDSLGMRNRFGHSVFHLLHADD